MRDRLSPRWVLAGVTGLVLLALSGRYGYHRDELYFLEAGRHLAWGYPDQPPLTPLLARLASEVAPGSLVVLRLPSTLSAAAVVWLAGRMARDLGASRGGEWLAAGATALCGFVVATGHLLSTATTGVLGTALASYLLLRLLRDDHPRPRGWLLLGLVVGVTLQANVFPAAVLAMVVVGLVVAGPRAVLRSPWPWLAALVALAVVAPYVVWQADHGWPQLDVARGIASGGSGSSVSRPLFVPFELLQGGPWLVLVWAPGLVRLLRDPRLRCLGLAFLLANVLFLVGGGKPYYLAGLLPLLLAAGAQPVLDAVGRRWVLVGAVLSTPTLVFTLPLLPVDHAGVAVAVNPDTGETIGWPQLVDQLVAASRDLPPGAPVLAANYGEAGAVDRFGPPGLAAYSGQNAYWLWGPPPGSVTVVAVGIDDALLADVCTDVRDLGELHSAHGTDNDEDGTPLRSCTPVRPWRDLWPRFRRYG